MHSNREKYPLNFMNMSLKNKWRHNCLQTPYCNPFQSAYCKFHSIMTILFSVHSDTIHSVDSGKVIACALLDQSAAFDTVYHGLLLHHCAHWFVSDLAKLVQIVSISKAMSHWVPFTCSISQGFFLGPLLISIYTIPKSVTKSKWFWYASFTLMTLNSIYPSMSLLLPASSLYYLTTLCVFSLGWHKTDCSWTHLKTELLWFL